MSEILIQMVVRRFLVVAARTQNLTIVVKRTTESTPKEVIRDEVVVIL